MLLSLYLFGSASQIFFCWLLLLSPTYTLILKEVRDFFSNNQRTSGSRTFIKTKASQNSSLLDCHQIWKLVALSSRLRHTTLPCKSILEDEGAFVTHLRRLNSSGELWCHCMDHAALQASRQELPARMQCSYSNVLARGFWCMEFLLNQFELVLSHI